VIYLTLYEDIPDQRYITLDTGAVAVRLGAEEAEEIAIAIFQLLSRCQQPCPNVVSITEFTEKSYIHPDTLDCDPASGSGDCLEP
jgi:hypothetical protein